MAARERQPDVLRLRRVQNVLVLGHDEFVDDPALAVVDGDLVSGDGSGGWSRRLLQLRGGARPRVPDRAVREQGRGTDEEAGPPLAPPQARSSPRPDASRGGGGGGGGAGHRAAVGLKPD